MDAERRCQDEHSGAGGSSLVSHETKGRAGKAIRSKIVAALPPRVRAALRVAEIATLRGELPLHARANLLMRTPMMLMPAQSTDFRLMLPGGPIYLGRDSFYIDSLVLDYLWNGHVFQVNCQDRVLLDLGAHKGYVGAWALEHGASFVISCEPQSDNVHVLERTRSENLRSQDWEVMPVAVGASDGEASLYVSCESWAHSIYADMVEVTSVEKVAMVTLAAVMARAAEKRPKDQVVIKINVEGSAGPILMAAAADVLAPVVEVHIDYEPGSPYDIAELLRHLARAGLDHVDNVGEKLWVVSRAGSS